MEPAGTKMRGYDIDDVMWNLNRKLAGARAAIEQAHRRIKNYEVQAAEQLAVCQDVRRQMHLLGIKEHV